MDCAETACRARRSEPLRERCLCLEDDPGGQEAGKDALVLDLLAFPASAEEEEELAAGVVEERAAAAKAEAEAVAAAATVALLGVGDAARIRKSDRG